jgi:hypothetical protein
MKEERREEKEKGGLYERGEGVQLSVCVQEKGAKGGKAPHHTTPHTTQPNTLTQPHTLVVHGPSLTPTTHPNTPHTTPTTKHTHQHTTTQLVVYGSARERAATTRLPWPFVPVRDRVILPCFRAVEASAQWLLSDRPVRCVYSIYRKHRFFFYQNGDWAVFFCFLYVRTVCIFYTHIYRYIIRVGWGVFLYVCV